MERMEREIRAAYPVDRANKGGNLGGFDNEFVLISLGAFGSDLRTNSQQITFGNDLNGSYDILTDDDNTYDYSEVIVYCVKNNNLMRYTSGSTCNNSGGAVLADLGPNGNLEFTYFDGDTEVTPNFANQPNIDTVQVELTVDEGTAEEPRVQTLTTELALRSRME